MSKGLKTILGTASVWVVLLIDGRILNTDLIVGSLPVWSIVPIMLATVGLTLFGLYQLIFVERNKFALGGVGAAIVIGAVLVLNQSDTGSPLALMQSEEERDFRNACEEAGNSNEACDCAWEGFEKEFSGLHLKVLVASLAKDQALVRRLMSEPNFDQGAYFGSVLQRTPAIERRCRVAF